MQQLGFKILNDIAWEKPNPPPNLSCRYFTHSTETILWATENTESKYLFNYKAMKIEAAKDAARRRGVVYMPTEPLKQMKTVWTMTAPGKAEKTFGKHPTQKPVALVHCNI